jgi:hypothetical protein
VYAVHRAEWIKGAGRFASRPHPWVARINGLDPTYGFAREFIKGVYDYTYARKSQSRGVFVYFALAPGFYELCYHVSWKRQERYFISVDENGDMQRIYREELLECLKNGISE